MGTLPDAYSLGHTREKALQEKLTFARGLKRKNDLELPGTGKLNTPETGIKKVILRHEPVPKEEALFTTHDQTGEIRIKMNDIESDINNGKLVFIYPGEQKKYTNPTSWLLKVRLRVRQSGAGDAKYTAFDQAALPAALIAAQGGNPEVPAVPATPHVRFCNFPEVFIQDHVDLLFNGNNLNHTDQYEDFIQYMGYVLTVNEKDKWDETNIHEKFAHPGCITGEHRTRIGHHRADTTKAHQADLSDTELGSRVLEEAFWNMHERAGDTDGVDLIIGPLRGPWFALNEFFPLKFLPKAVVKLRLNEPQRFMLARESSANGEGAALAGNATPAVTIVSEKTRLIIPWVRMQDKENDDTDRMFFKLSNKPYTSEKRVECWVSSGFIVQNNNNGPPLELPTMTDLEGRFPDQVGMGFIYTDLLRGEGRTFITEKMPFTRCGISKVQIKLNGLSIFPEGPLNWSDEKKNNLHLWKMQSDYWGNRANPNRYNGACANPQDHPDGAKWVWLTLNPNFNGGIEAIERLDKQIKVEIWGDAGADNARQVSLVFFAPGAKIFMCQSAVEGKWTGPENIITSSLNVDFPRVYNAEGGDFHL